jgi:hypothetical protein
MGGDSPIQAISLLHSGPQGPDYIAIYFWVGWNDKRLFLRHSTLQKFSELFKVYFSRQDGRFMNPDSSSE